MVPIKTFGPKNLPFSLWAYLNPKVNSNWTFITPNLPYKEDSKAQQNKKSSQQKSYEAPGIYGIWLYYTLCERTSFQINLQVREVKHKYIYPRSIGDQHRRIKGRNRRHPPLPHWTGWPKKLFSRTVGKFHMFLDP